MTAAIDGLRAETNRFEGIEGVSAKVHTNALEALGRFPWLQSAGIGAGLLSMLALFSVAWGAGFEDQIINAIEASDAAGSDVPAKEIYENMLQQKLDQDPAWMKGFLENYVYSREGQEKLLAVGGGLAALGIGSYFMGRKK